jgi:uncharacterized protein (DUF3084 family)
MDKEQLKQLEKMRDRAQREVDALTAALDALRNAQGDVSAQRGGGNGRPPGG